MKEIAISGYKLSLDACRVCGSCDVLLQHKFPNSLVKIWPSSNMSESLNTSELMVFRCLSCGHYQLQDLSLDFIKFLYEGDYFNLESEIINQDRADFIKSFGIKLNQKILDVGGGTNSSHYLFQGQEYTVLDPQKPGNDEILHIAGLVSDCKLQQNHYDYIFAFHIIEHLDRPFDDLLKLRNSLKNEGKIFIEIPDANFYAKNMPHYLYFFQHISIFSEKSIEQLLNRCGFKIISINSNFGRILIVAEKTLSNLNSVENVGKNIRALPALPSPDFFIKLDSIITKEVVKFNLEKVALLGCGGSSALLINRCPDLKSMITDYHDSDLRKIGKFMPGTEITVQNLPKDLVENVLWISWDIEMFLSIFSAEKVNFIDLAALTRKINNYG
jgi:hypothetical protein